MTDRNNSDLPHPQLKATPVSSGQSSPRYPVDDSLPPASRTPHFMEGRTDPWRTVSSSWDAGSVATSSAQAPYSGGQANLESDHEIDHTVHTELEHFSSWDSVEEHLHNVTRPWDSLHDGVGDDQTEHSDVMFTAAGLFSGLPSEHLNPSDSPWLLSGSGDWIDDSQRHVPVDPSPAVGTASTLMSLTNPFRLEFRQTAHRYDKSRRGPKHVPANGEINGYVKFQIHHHPLDTIPHDRLSHAAMLHRRTSHSPIYFMQSSIPKMPSNFGRMWRPEGIDFRLLQFYMYAFCAGRTILHHSNAYLEILKMCDASDCVRHAVLALAAGYLLDYWPEDDIIWATANAHYQQATDLLTQSLHDPSIRMTGNEDSTVGSLVLLFSDDIINWELRNKGDEDPLWRRGSRLARALLDASDPSNHYHHIENVQISGIRAANANMVAYIEICALPVMPLRAEGADRLFPWLLGGSQRDRTRIYGGIGVSPKLLHIFGQITHFSAWSARYPESPAWSSAAEHLEEGLVSLVQWSELNPEGYDDFRALLGACDACKIDPQGFVDDPALVTDLTAETWRQAAKIYLDCRFHRLPRHHREVQKALNRLLCCLSRMPTSGKLFTAQSPFFCVFLAATVAYQPSDRNIIRNWFEQVVSDLQARSSVPPIWRVVQEYWAWTDTDLPWIEDDSSVPLAQRYPWWEVMVDRFVKIEGQLSLV